VTPSSLLAWQRVRMANMMSSSGQDWFFYISQYNSGTYNNQYMVVNYNQFQVGQPMPDNTLWVMEQIPGLVAGADTTATLERGYFSSYNVPYFEQVYNLSGYPEMAKKYGVGVTYQLAPRAQIFRREQNTVVDLNTLKALMRYNNPDDPYFGDSPMDAICSRGDLLNPPSLGGCYDSKVTSSKLVPSMTSHAVNGPTTAFNLPPFSWEPRFASTSHFGQPVTFDFDFVVMAPDFDFEWAGGCSCLQAPISTNVDPRSRSENA